MTAAPDPRTPDAARGEIVRVDRYTVEVNGHTVRATADQEARLRSMDPEQIDRFLTVMGVRDD
jgi:hypothetical protein